MTYNGGRTNLCRRSCGHVDRAVTAEPSPAPNRYCSLPVYFVGRICHSLPCRTESRTFSAQAWRLTGCSPAGPGARVAQAQSRRYSVTDCLLALDLFCLRYPDCPRPGRRMGAGKETMRLAAGTAHGTAFQEAVIRGVAYSSAPTGLISFSLILWGLRGGCSDSSAASGLERSRA